jgi:hypothetical protein
MALMLDMMFFGPGQIQCYKSHSFSGALQTVLI